jgi:hypothetical protein
LLAWTPALAQPVVDTHVHYNRETWRVYPPEDTLALMDAAGIRWALVSSTPDDGTLALYELAPQRVVPMLRPYRVPSDFLTWTTDPSVLADIETRLQTGVPYRGIGEFELEPGQAYHSVPRRLADLAAERGLWLHAHAQPLAIGELAALRRSGSGERCAKRCAPPAAVRCSARSSLRALSRGDPPHEGAIRPLR